MSQSLNDRLHALEAQLAANTAAQNELRKEQPPTADLAAEQQNAMQTLVAERSLARQRQALEADLAIVMAQITAAAAEAARAELAAMRTAADDQLAQLAHELWQCYETALMVAALRDPSTRLKRAVDGDAAGYSPIPAVVTAEAIKGLVIGCLQELRCVNYAAGPGGLVVERTGVLLSPAEVAAAEAKAARGELERRRGVMDKLTKGK